MGQLNRRNRIQLLCLNALVGICCVYRAVRLDVRGDGVCKLMRTVARIVPPVCECANFLNLHGLKMVNLSFTLSMPDAVTVVVTAVGYVPKKP